MFLLLGRRNDQQAVHVYIYMSIYIHIGRRVDPQGVYIYIYKLISSYIPISSYIYIYIYIWEDALTRRESMSIYIYTSIFISYI